MKLKLDANGNVVLIEKDGVKLPVYVHDDGKEIPHDAAGTVAAITRLNGEAMGHRQRAEKAEGDLKKFDGLDADAARKALDTVKNIDDKKLVDAGQVEEVRAAAVRTYEERLQAQDKAHGEKIAALAAEKDKLASALSRELIGGNFARSKFIAEKVAVPADVVQAIFEKHYKVEDGQIAAYGTDGKRIHSRARPGDPNCDFDEALEILFDGYAHKSQILKGSGANGGGGGPSGGNVKKALKDMTETERTQLYRSNPQEFERLKKEAA